jgi:dTDP-4-dehydrorhamnose reductase
VQKQDSASYLRLRTCKLQQAFGLVLLPWQQGVNRMLAEII